MKYYSDLSEYYKSRKINPNTVPKIPGVPVIPPLPKEEPFKQYTFQCGECGILVPNGPWGYSCQNSRCPIFPQVTC